MPLQGSQVSENPFLGSTAKVSVGSPHPLEGYGAPTKYQKKTFSRNWTTAFSIALSLRGLRTLGIVIPQFGTSDLEYCMAWRCEMYPEISIPVGLFHFKLTAASDPWKACTHFLFPENYLKISLECCYWDGETLTWWDIGYIFFFLSNWVLWYHWDKWAIVKRKKKSIENHYKTCLATLGPILQNRHKIMLVKHLIHNTEMQETFFLNAC